MQPSEKRPQTINAAHLGNHRLKHCTVARHILIIELAILLAAIATLIGIFVIGTVVESFYDPIEDLQLARVLTHLYERNQQLTVVDVVLILGCSIKKAERVIAYLEKHFLIVPTFDHDGELTIYKRATKSMMK